MSAQSATTGLANQTLHGVATLVNSVGEGKSLLSAGLNTADDFVNVGLDNPTGNKDMLMAAKARKETQAKINAIMRNKEISNKAKTRRVGKILDEFEQGGK